MKLWKKLQNPYALVGQGFVLGGALFFATHPASLQATSSPTASPDSVIAAVEAGR